MVKGIAGNAGEGDSQPLARFGEVSAELQMAHRELATLLAAEHEAKVKSWFAANDDTIKGRDRVAEFNALDLTLDVIKLKGDIAALREEKDWLAIQLGARDLQW